MLIRTNQLQCLARSEKSCPERRLSGLRHEKPGTMEKAPGVVLFSISKGVNYTTRRTKKKKGCRQDVIREKKGDASV